MVPNLDEELKNYFEELDLINFRLFDYTRGKKKDYRYSKVF